MMNLLRFAWSAVSGLPSINGILMALVLGGGVAAYLWQWDTGRIKSAERRGGQQVIEKVETANDQATKAGRASANSSGVPGTSGVRSPRYRN